MLARVQSIPCSFKRKVSGTKTVFVDSSFSYYLVPETMSLLHVQCKVCMAPFHVRSKVCIAPIHVRSKFSDSAPHMVGNNAEFSLHMEGSHADFAPHIERRHSFRDQKIAQMALSAKFLKEIV